MLFSIRLLFVTAIVLASVAAPRVSGPTNAEVAVVQLPDDVIAQRIVDTCRVYYHREVGSCACYDNRKGFGFARCGRGSADEQRRAKGLLGLFCFPHQVTSEDIRRWRGKDYTMIYDRCGKTPR